MVQSGENEGRTAETRHRLRARAPALLRTILVALFNRTGRARVTPETARRLGGERDR